MGTSSGGESSTPIATGISGTTYTATGLTNWTTYYFTVVAVNAFGASGSSNEASATPQDIPPAPLELGATAGNAQILLSWADAPNAASYNVYEGTSPGGESSYPVASGITANAYMVTGLANGTTYYFTVAAVNIDGTSPHSNEANATPGATTANVYNYSVSYDAVGNVSSYNDLVNGAWSNIGYDSLNRLTGATAPVSGTTQYFCWSYDSFGNRLAQVEQSTPCSAPPAAAAYNANNQVTWVQNTSPTGFVYDAAGNVQQDNINNYLYDAEGRICAVQNRTVGSMTGYIYDADGNRVVPRKNSIREHEGRFLTVKTCRDLG
jgi:hypothetical protein